MQIATADNRMQPIIQSSQELHLYGAKRIEKQIKPWHWVILIANSFFCIYFYSAEVPQTTPLLVVTFVEVFFGAYVVSRFKVIAWDHNMLIKHWLNKNNFSVIPAEEVMKKIWQRLLANPQKKFLLSQTMLADQKFSRSKINLFAEGKLNDRNVWIYPIIITVANNLALVIWCIEIATHRIPTRALITRKYLQHWDTLDTESRHFENLYHTHVVKGHTALQLLDPVMIDLITKSRVSAMEFSDSSVVFFNDDTDSILEALDVISENGLKIAKQVDRNFPLNK
jgi:hypothetical protein